MDIGKITAYDFRTLRNYMSQYAESSLRNILSSFGLFIKYYTGTDPCKEARLRWNGIEMERIWITSSDWKKLFDAADPLERLVLTLGGSMGLRRTEILSIKTDDLKGNILRVTGKGTGNGKIVDMEMSAPVLKCLGPYLQWRNEIVAKYGDRSCGNLFICPLMKTIGKPLTPTVLNYMTEELSQKTGIKWTLHSLRRLFCMTMVDAGIDLDTTRRMMRHASMDTTINAYIKADPRKIQGAFSAVNSTFAAFTN